MNGYPMRPLHLIVAVVLFLSAGISAQKTHSADSSAAAADGKASSIDGDLILDDNDNSILPAEAKKTAAPVVVPAIKTALKADTTASNSTAPAVPAAPPSSLPQTGSAAAAPAQKVTDEELILDGGAEELLGKEKTPRPKTALPAGETASRPDSAAGKQTTAVPALPTPGAFADSAAHTAQPAAAISAPPAKIEDARAINFARNLKEYRSPKLAMLMSLVLPGSGQVYAKSNLWAAGFGAIG